MLEEIPDCLYSFSIYKLETFFKWDESQFLFQDFINRYKHQSLKNNYHMNNNREDYEKGFEFLERQYIR